MGGAVVLSPVSANGASTRSFWTIYLDFRWFMVRSRTPLFKTEDFEVGGTAQKLQEYLGPSIGLDWRQCTQHNYILLSSKRFNLTVAEARRSLAESQQLRSRELILWLYTAWSNAGLSSFVSGAWLLISGIFSVQKVLLSRMVWTPEKQYPHGMIRRLQDPADCQLADSASSVNYS